MKLEESAGSLLLETEEGEEGVVSFDFLLKRAETVATTAHAAISPMVRIIRKEKPIAVRRVTPKMRFCSSDAEPTFLTRKKSMNALVLDLVDMEEDADDASGREVVLGVDESGAASASLGARSAG